MKHVEKAQAKFNDLLIKNRKLIRIILVLLVAIAYHVFLGEFLWSFLKFGNYNFKVEIDFKIAILKFLIDFKVVILY
jgi:hypothetical protein